MELDDLAVEVAEHEPLTEQLEAIHLGLDTASAVIAGPLSPERPAEAYECAQVLVAALGTWTVLLPRPGVPARRDDRIGASRGDGIAAGATVIGAVGDDRRDRLALRDLRQQLGDIGASPTVLSVNSTAHNSVFASSMPRCILHSRRLRASPCLRAYHSPSPRTLMPALSTSRGSGSSGL